MHRNTNTMFNNVHNMLVWTWCFVCCLLVCKYMLVLWVDDTWQSKDMASITTMLLAALQLGYTIQMLEHAQWTTLVTLHASVTSWQWTTVAAQSKADLDSDEIGTCCSSANKQSSQADRSKITSTLWVQAKMDCKHQQILEPQSQHVPIMLYACFSEMFQCITKLHLLIGTLILRPKHVGSTPSPATDTAASKFNEFALRQVRYHTTHPIKQIDLRSKKLAATHSKAGTVSELQSWPTGAPQCSP